MFWRRRGPGISEDGTRVRAFGKAWAAACVKAGLGTEHRDENGRLVRRRATRIPHDFRRTAVRNLELAGVPRSVAMEMVGHKTEGIYRRYAIVDSEAMRHGAELLARLHEAQALEHSKVIKMGSR